MRTINLTPVGLQTPEGCARATKAQDAFNGSAHEVANAAAMLVTMCGEAIVDAMKNDFEAEQFAEYWDELQQAIETRRRAQEEFLRSIAGAPPAAA